MMLVSVMMNYRNIAVTMLGTGAFYVPSIVHAAGGEATGLPQLDITTWPNQLFWLVVTFTIGYFLMSRLVAPRIGSVLDMRQKTIKDDLESAKQAESEAQSMKAEYEASLETARSAAAEAAQKAMNEAKANAEAAESELTAKLSKKTKTAETKLAKMRDDALASINDVASEVTQDAVMAVAGLKVSKADAAKSVKKMAGLSGQEA